ncbi:MAG: flagellar hook-length control protein FliK [Phycisphaerae bacterium]|nr:flagellar hook-length control protein FliK [Phycisphaerae bacterium]MDW8261612.1 flagellar hook-length control protein FliK [Phycisphaerales bacterium]
MNHPRIVSAVRGQLLPDGGTMQIRLDPPELGTLLIHVTVRGGLVEATFQTPSAQASQLLSHSLVQLKHALESQGVGVDRLSVSQAPRNERWETAPDRHSSAQQQQSHWDWERHGEQQRRDALRRMWARLGVGDPLDLVA